MTVSSTEPVSSLPVLASPAQHVLHTLSSCATVLCTVVSLMMVPPSLALLLLLLLLPPLLGRHRPTLMGAPLRAAGSGIEEQPW